MLPLKVSFIQAPLEWHNAAANRDYFTKKITQGVNSDLWLLPEMFTTGFTMQPQQVAEGMDGETVNWMIWLAKEKQTAIGGSVVIKTENGFVNRFILVKKAGDVFYYDKRHLFTLAGEQNFYQPGHQRTVVTVSGWRICLQVCYDLRFPVFTRNTKENPFDLLVYVANWPVPRIQQWDKLLVARAIENQCYVIGLNRIGTDLNGVLYSGHSAAIDFMGDYLTQAGETEGVFSTSLDKDKLVQFREKFPVLNDADLFTLG